MTLEHKLINAQHRLIRMMAVLIFISVSFTALAIMEALHAHTRLTDLQEVSNIQPHNSGTESDLFAIYEGSSKRPQP